MYDYLKWIILPSNARFLPSISFNKRTGIFSLFFYLDADSAPCKFNFFYDGGDILPNLLDLAKDAGISGKKLDIISIIPSYFSFSITNLRKAIHLRSKRKIVLSPKIALINSRVFGIKQTRKSKLTTIFTPAQKTKFLIEFSSNSPELSHFVELSAKLYDYSFFYQWVDTLKLLLSNFNVEEVGKKADAGSFVVDTVDCVDTVALARRCLSSISKSDGFAFDAFSELVLVFQKNLC